MSEEAEYLAKRGQSAGRAALEEMLARVDSMPPGGQDAPPQPEQEGITAKGIAKDIGGGIVESPKQIAGGINDAVVNALKLADPLVEWLEKNVAELPRYEVPTVDPARTVTGNVVREGARFLTGFVPAFRALKGIGLAAPAASIGGGAVSEAATANPTSEGLSNLIQGVPALQNPVTEFLSSNPDDPESLNRLRKGIEGAGFGLIAEGVGYGIRAVAKSIGKGKVVDPAIEMKAKYGEVKDEDFAILGDMNKPLVSAQKLDKAFKATEGVEPQALKEVGEAGGEKIFVNFARIETADDVKKMIGKTADLFAKDIDKARRGVQSHEATSQLADDLGMSVTDLLSRRKGEGFNAEQALAARRLWTASGERLLEAADKASAPSAGKTDQFNFRRMMAVHQAIQTEVIGARTETARALNSWAIPAGSNAEKARAISQLLDSMGGAETSQELAKRLSMLGKAGASPQALASVVRQGWGATTMDMVKESFVNGLLWTPATHAVNVTSNTAFMTTQIVERGLASEITSLLGRAPGQGVQPGEAMAMTYGLVTGFRDAFRAAAKGLKTGESTQLVGKIDLPREAAISTRTISREVGHSFSEMEALQQSNLGKAIDLFGTVTRVPGRLLVTEDEFFKSLGYRMELHAQSVRMAAGEGRTGPDLYRRMAEIVSNPPENVRISAADAALYNTFQSEPGWLAQSILTARNRTSVEIGGKSFGVVNPLFLFAPFIRTPANLINRAFERTPLGPLMASVRADFSAGGARADLAAARIALGSTTLAVVGDLAYSGLISGAGPDDPGEREALQRTGWQQFAIRTGDNWVQYNRLDPMGLMFGVSATLAEMTKRFDIEPEEMDEWQEIAGAMVGAISKSIVNRTYLESLSRVVDAIASGDQNPRQVAKVIEETTASLVPFTSAGSAAKRATDPIQREPEGIWETIQARLPEISKNLKPARDLWGKEKQSDEVYGRFVDVVSPMAIRGQKDSPIDDEMVRLNLDVRRIPSKGDFNGVPINLREYKDVKDAYEKLAGNELKINGLGAKDFLDKVVSGQHAMSGVYQSLPDTEEGKGAFIKDVIGRYRTAARMKILTDPRFSEFRADWDDRRMEIMRRTVPQ